MEEKFCFQGGKTYCPAPFFWTDSGFGLYADTCESTAFDFREGEIIAELPKNCVITLFSGTPESMIAEYLSLFGSPVLPPDWAFGPWISANRWSSQADVENAVAEAERLAFPSPRWSSRPGATRRLSTSGAAQSTRRSRTARRSRSRTSTSRTAPGPTPRA